MKIIENRKDIEFLVDEFYKKVVEDNLLGHLFTDIIKLDFEKHKPIMCDFWESNLLEKFTYKGNPLLKHLQVNKLTPLKEDHFSRWIDIWEKTIYKNFNGEKADQAIQRAKIMGHVITSKINEGGNNKFI